MPTAIKFESEGLDNGFPICLRKYDIKPELDSGELDMWTTFSGHTSTSAPTQESIDDSRRAAMKLFWNLSGVNFTASSVYPSESASANGINTLNEPRGRACYAALDEDEIHGVIPARIIVGYIIDEFTIQRLYYGDTFLGYGSEIDVFNVANNDGLFHLTSLRTTTPALTINLLGGSGVDENDTSRDAANAVVNIDGIFFVCHTSCFSSSTNISLDPSNMQSSADSFNGDASVSFDITSLNFYAYPS